MTRAFLVPFAVELLKSSLISTSGRRPVLSAVARFPPSLSKFCFFICKRPTLSPSALLVTFFFAFSALGGFFVAAFQRSSEGSYGGWTSQGVSGRDREHKRTIRYMSHMTRQTTHGTHMVRTCERRSVRSRNGPIGESSTSGTLVPDLKKFREYPRK